MRAERAFAFAWAAALLCVWYLRPPLAPDELRYLSVAWEMRDHGSWLVPLLNGEPYSHKPPLMFWLWQVSWLPFGPSLLAARLVQATAAGLAVLLTMRLARALAPREAGLPGTAALILGGSVALQIYSSFLSFDLWLSVFVLVSWLGLVRAIPPPNTTAASPRLGWVLFALGLGAAILTKGPAAFVAILPPALLHPWWSGARGRGSARWLGLTTATLFGCAIALAWALPAAEAGGEKYGSLILWGQTAGRVTDSFAHARPFYFYLLLLPVGLLPWILLPRFWQRRAEAPSRVTARFALAALIPAFIMFSAISGKQPHYLLPLMPACALFAAARLVGGTAAPRMRIAPWACLAPLLALLVNLGFGLGWGARWDLQPAADAVAKAQAEGREVALFGMAYHGQFHFLGGLHSAIADPPGPRGMREWSSAHPDGLALLVMRREGGPEPRPEHVPILPFGSRVVALWRASELAPLWPPAPQQITGD